MEELNIKGWVMLILFALFITVVPIGGCMYGWPQYKVWEQGLVGQAELSRAIQNRQIKVQEAEAIKDAADLLGQAEVARARGVAQANTIIGGSLKGNEAYLRYLWIHNMAETKNQVIYLPTEAGLPILESTRLSHMLEGAPRK